MILEFCVSNYLSIKEELKLSFVSTPLKESCSEPNDLFPLEDTGISLVRGAVIYGANASGKSNVLKGFDFYKRFITDSFRNSQVGESIGIENFRLNASSVKEPTAFEATFTDGKFIYRYGFEADNHTVHEEWLYKRACKKRAKDVELFYREADGTTVHPKSRLMQELVNKKMIRSNALLLSTAAQFNEPTAVGILGWLNDTLVVFCSEDDKLWNNAIKRLDDEALRNRIISFAKYADLGIENISKIDNRIVSDHRQYDDEGREVNSVTFAFNQNESEGTIKYFSLAYPIIDALDNGKRIVIDELDSKLHPLLVKKIVTLFNDAKTNPKGAQLLFTAHDTFLLSAGLFRRDQVWFTQKDNFGATELFSLAEYKVRSTSPFERDYLLGKYGATPIFGDIEKIFNPA
ncbi:AAA15 family ATPase/GTPase [Bacteroides zoogleoformans]|uniref:ATPase n=1 Tax=Bacteroides zoogleoformans TaxID=28119 RepID=A0ABM6TAX6_9BACE|nr:ATP-binding protein [Bacteroides zoogleoformans]AVM53961.1 ATPase [Bacteroides zoogleoformans]TWJ16539.1 AAA15 family ATPase/GTPase [Bacteroides zoogleoformans]